MKKRLVCIDRPNSIRVFSPRLILEWIIDKPTKITLTGDTLRALMQQSARFGIEHYSQLKELCNKKWDYHNAFFFTGTLATTIGYGNLVPKTDNGRIFCLCFCLIGKQSKNFNDSSILVIQEFHVSRTWWRNYQISLTTSWSMYKN